MSMQFVELILGAITLVALILVASLHPRRTRISRYELERRATGDDQSARDELHRDVVLDDLLVVRRTIEAVLLTLCIVFALNVFGGWGVLITIVIALLYRRVARIEVIGHGAMLLYDRYEAGILRVIGRSPQLIKMLRGVGSVDREPPYITSREELQHILDGLTELLSNDERKLMQHGLEFESKTVADAMVPRSVVTTVNKNELVGPLLLSELHQTGHSRFPVVDGTIDKVVGILYIRDLLTLRSKTSAHAHQVMDKAVYYIHESQSLSHALGAFLKVHHHLFVVVNDYQETTGIITLEDCLEALLGRRIIDEDDIHADLRAVAQQLAKEKQTERIEAEV